MRALPLGQVNRLLGTVVVREAVFARQQTLPGVSGGCAALGQAAGVGSVIAKCSITLRGWNVRRHSAAVFHPRRLAVFIHDVHAGDEIRLARGQALGWDEKTEGRIGLVVLAVDVRVAIRVDRGFLPIAAVIGHQHLVALKGSIFRHHEGVTADGFRSDRQNAAFRRHTAGCGTVLLVAGISRQSGTRTDADVFNAVTHSGCDAALRVFDHLVKTRLDEYVELLVCHRGLQRRAVFLSGFETEVESALRIFAAPEFQCLDCRCGELQRNSRILIRFCFHSYGTLRIDRGRNTGIACGTGLQSRLDGRFGQPGRAGFGTEPRWRNSKRNRISCCFDVQIDAVVGDIPGTDIAVVRGVVTGLIAIGLGDQTA